MKKQMEKTIQQRQATIDRNYRRLFVLLALCLILFIAFAAETLS